MSLFKIAIDISRLSKSLEEWQLEVCFLFHLVKPINYYWRGMYGVLEVTITPRVRFNVV